MSAGSVPVTATFARASRPRARRASEGWLPPGPRGEAILQALRLRDDCLRFLEASGVQYGPSWTLRLPYGPPCVVTSDRDAIRRLLTGDPLTKRHGHERLEIALGARSMFVLDPAEHLARRRIELPAFRGEVARRHVSRVQGLIDEELASWAPGAVVRSHERGPALMRSLMVEAVLGSTDHETNARLRSILKAWLRPSSDLGLVVPPVLIRRARWNVVSEGFWTLRDRLLVELAGLVALARADDQLESRSDVLALLIRARGDDGRRLADDEIIDELLSFIAAGQDTTASTIAWSLDLLAHHPLVAEQVRATLADGDRDYLRAVAREVMRVRTVVPMTVLRRVSEPFPIGDGVVDPGVVVRVNAHALHHDPVLHAEPDAFRPERFLSDDAPPYSFLPFGGGAHRCIGAPLATGVLESVIAGVTSRWVLQPASPPAQPVRTMFLAPADGGPVRITARRPPN